MTESKIVIGPIPDHLRKYAWYAQHQAYLRDQGRPHHDPGSVIPVRANLTGAELTRANLTWATLTEANLTWATLTEANLTEANLTWADLTRAVGLPAAPVVPRIDEAILSAIEAGGTLDMSNWHTCDTTHCRAGWAVTLAGEAGRELERRTSPYLAGRLIYEASRPGVPCPDFFANDQDAMDDIKRCAASNT